MAYGNALSDFKPLKPAESQLLRNSQWGRSTVIGDEVPEGITADNEVRASFVRFLLMTDSLPVRATGVVLKGAWISGVLDLKSARIHRALSLQRCFIDKTMKFTDAEVSTSLDFTGSIIASFVFAARLRLDGMLCMQQATLKQGMSLFNAQIRGRLSFLSAVVCGRNGKTLNAGGVICQAGVNFSKSSFSNGSLILVDARIQGELSFDGARVDAGALHSIKADRLAVSGSVFFREGFSAIGPVSFRGATVGSQFNCDGGSFDGMGQPAITAESMKVSGSVFMQSGFSATGSISLTSAQIGGNLNFSRMKHLDGLSAARLTVGGELVLRNLKAPLSQVTLAGAQVGVLSDDVSAWGDNLVLNGFVYGLIDVHGSVSVADRLLWLQKQQLKLKPSSAREDFRPQPWRQLRKVLEEMGHEEEAREIGIAYERELSRLDLVGQTPKNWPGPVSIFYKLLMRLLHWSYGKLTGYGYRPMLLLKWFVLMWGVCTVIYWGAANQFAVFAPSNPLVFQNKDYERCRPPAVVDASPAPGTGNWYLCDLLPEEYTGFSPIAFSLDLLLPLVDLHQENDWAPLIATPQSNVAEELLGMLTIKRLVRMTMWVEILAGWIFSLLFVAVVSGSARRKE